MTPDFDQRHPPTPHTPTHIQAPDFAVSLYFPAHSFAAFLPKMDTLEHSFSRLALPSQLQHPPPASLVELPEALHQTIIFYLPQWDVGTLLQVSKALAQIAAPTIVSLAPLKTRLPSSYRPEALLRLLKKTSKLQSLEMAKDNGIEEKEKGRALILALCDGFSDGAVGSQLRSLRFGSLGFHLTNMIVALMDVLKAGWLPCLEEIQIGGLGIGTLDNKGDEPVGLFLAEALEARRALGMPPVTSIKGIADTKDIALLRRIWACCPLDKVTHLEAYGTEPIEALEEHMQSHASAFAALRSLHLDCDVRSMTSGVGCSSQA
jgi:hypothetical protein